MEFLEIFKEMHWVPAMFLIAGIVMIIVEVFVEGFGFFGFGGIISLLVGVIVRICFGLNLTQSLILILMVVAFLSFMFMLMFWCAQHGILSKTALFEKGTTISPNYNEVSEELKKLVGLEGETISELNMAGTAKINGKIYEVLSATYHIEANSKIKVVEVKDNTIFVEKV